VTTIIGLLLVIITLLLVLIILLVGGTSLLGWVLVGIIGAGVVAMVVLWIPWTEFVGISLVVGVVVIGAAYLLEGISYLAPIWLSNWLLHSWGMLVKTFEWMGVPHRPAITLAIVLLVLLAAAPWEIKRTRHINKQLRDAAKHPQYGDPDYLDWANRRGRYAGRGSEVGRW
jgi:hypothetical protein